MSLKGTETEKNLVAAFIKEAVTGCKYTIFANIAKSQGYETVARIFETAANNEKEHAKLWLKLLKENILPDTAENLANSAREENFEWSNMYMNYAKQAKEDGFEHIAGLFEKVADIEKHHEHDFKNLITLIKEENIQPDENGEYTYYCSECGCIIKQKERPDYCPLCKEPNVFFYKKK